MRPAAGKVTEIENSMVIKGKSVHVPGPHVKLPELAASIPQKYFESLRAALRGLSMPQKCRKMVVGHFVMVWKSNLTLPPELYLR
jgi:hypothetical protein